MTNKLIEILKTQKVFKLVCGAGNENAEEVEKLVYLYSKAGCQIFDISANIEVLKSAKNGLHKSGITENRFVCVSVGIKGDPHTKKASIDINKCRKCLKCHTYCPQRAISKYIVDNSKCIGCSKCLNVCAYEAINTTSYPTDLEEVLPKIIEAGIDCLEFHAISSDDKDVFEKWDTINNLYTGPLSICVDREKLSNEQLISRLNKMLKNRPKDMTIIQADGAPMSGGIDDYKTTLQAVATAELIRKNNIPAFILLSGGTNSKSGELAKLCEVDINGVAIGSYARSIVKDYLYGKMSEDEALQIASKLVKSIG